jgi:hypothetical protein
MIAGADWSPDGSMVAVSALGVMDSIHILDPEGGHLASFGFEGVRDVGSLSWCPDSDHLVFGAYYASRPSVGVLETSTGAFELHPSGVGGSQTPMCLGSGRHVAFQGPWNDVLQLLVLDLDSGVTVPVFHPGDGSKITRVSWVPDSIPVVIQSVSIQPAQLEVRWGQTTALRATGSFSDGTIRPVKVTWEALDPNRAFVDSTGMVVGNQAGSAPIVARFAGWMADTVMVRVLPWERPDVALRSDFHGQDLENWKQFSSPPARAVAVEGDTVLSLEGDGRFRDVLVSEETFSLDEGARVEVEFRLPLSRTDRQRIVLCVQPADEGETQAGPAYPEVSSNLAFCLRYPARELVKFDANEAMAWYDRLASREYFQLPEGMDSSEWTQFALEIAR